MVKSFDHDNGRTLNTLNTTMLHACTTYYHTTLKMQIRPRPLGNFLGVLGHSQIFLPLTMEQFPERRAMTSALPLLYSPLEKLLRFYREKLFRPLAALEPMSSAGRCTVGKSYNNYYVSTKVLRFYKSITSLQKYYVSKKVLRL